MSFYTEYDICYAEEEAFQKGKKQGALEEQKKFVKILQDINYLMESKLYVDIIDFTNKWLKELGEKE